MKLLTEYLSRKITEKQAVSLQKSLIPRQLEKNTYLTNSGRFSTGVYFVSADKVRVGNHAMARKKPGTFAATGLQELILNQTAKLDLILNEDTPAMFLPSESFYSLLRQSDWFPDFLLKIMASEEGLEFTSTHFIQDEKKLKLEKLVEASRILNSTLDLNQLLNVILDTSLSSVDGDRGTLYLIDYEKNELWSKVLDGSKKVTITLPVGKGIAGFVAQTGETVNIANAQSDERFNPEVDKRTGYHTESILCMPLKNKDGKILGVFQLLNKKGGAFSEDDEQFIESLSVNAAIAIENARLYEQEQQKIALEKEMSAAAEVQRSLFPTSIPKISGYDLFAHNIPATMVSGDLFDYFKLDDGALFFTLGDVSGKGLPAAILMANLQSVMRDLPHHNASTEYCATRVNRMINRSSGFDKFITLLIGNLNPKTHELTYTNCGHDYPFLFKFDGTFSRLKSNGIPIGMLPESMYEEVCVQMEVGDVLFVYSDGIPDATDVTGEMFGEDQMLELVRANLSLSGEEIIAVIENALHEHIGKTPQFDDMTMLVLKRSI